MAIFEIVGPKELLYFIRVAFNRYREGGTKSPIDALFMIMGLNHLREWIAPRYKGGVPKNADERFSSYLHSNPDYIRIRELCNGMKHLSPAPATRAEFGANIDEWHDVDEALSFDDGPPKAYFVEGAPLEDILKHVINLYEKHLNL